MKTSELERMFRERREAHGDLEVEARNRAGEFSGATGCAVVLVLRFL